MFNPPAEDDDGKEISYGVKKSNVDLDAAIGDGFLDNLEKKYGAAKVNMNQDDPWGKNPNFILKDNNTPSPQKKQQQASIAIEKQEKPK